jgi:guanine deaminase
MGFAILGTAFHAPKRGGVEILEDALIAIGSDGKIAAILRRGEWGYAERKAGYARDGTPITLKPGQYLLPGLSDLHIHALQWPQLGEALHVRLEDWLQKHTFPLEARDALWLATGGGADVLDIKTGRSAPGYEFDAILIDANVTASNLIIDRELDTLEDTLQKIAYNAGRANIVRTWVAGKQVAGI